MEEGLAGDQKEKYLMETETLILVAIAVVVLIGVGIAAWLISQKQRSRQLQEKYGPEYDYTVEKFGDRREAEIALQEREQRVRKLDIRSLGNDEKESFLDQWNEIQAAFVDHPSASVEAANGLIKSVMTARGFPVADFEQRAEDISVEYPNFVVHYRSAHEIAVRNQEGGATTEELRQSMVHYRTLFEQLLEIEESDFEDEAEEIEMVKEGLG
jgi:hypothetical protein